MEVKYYVLSQEKNNFLIGKHVKMLQTSLQRL